MSITEQGIAGERLARKILKGLQVDDIFQADWIVKKGGSYYVVEVKHKEIYRPPPFYGHGLDIRQVKARQKFYKETGIRCLFLVLDKSGKRYWGWLDELEEGKHIDTEHGIRVYDIKGFHELGQPTTKNQSA